MRRLTDDEPAEFALLLFSAGTETVARLLGSAAVCSPQHPDQRAELVADPSLLPNAVEELLRYEAPSPVQGRWTTRDVELPRRDHPGGLEGAAAHRSAGRDEREYPDADRFDVHRELRPPRLVRLRHPLLPRRRPGPHRGRIASRRCWTASRSGTSFTERAVRLHTSTVRGYSEVGMLVWAPEPVPFGPSMRPGRDRRLVDDRGAGHRRRGRPRRRPSRRRARSEASHTATSPISGADQPTRGMSASTWAGVAVAVEQLGLLGEDVAAGDGVHPHDRGPFQGKGGGEVLEPGLGGAVGGGVGEGRWATIEPTLTIEPPSGWSTMWW